MNLLDQFAHELGCSYLNLKDDIEYITDDTGFNVIDGEEADYGNILYYHADNLVCNQVIYGGDDEDFHFTKYGVDLLAAKLIEAINKRVEEYKSNLD